VEYALADAGVYFIDPTGETSSEDEEDSISLDSDDFSI